MSLTKLENRSVFLDFFRGFIVFLLITDLTSGFVVLFGFGYLCNRLPNKEILNKV